jgi:hypothetical protein|tara:strand:+ start:357 stop:497 length:141 start_codon:yes stop_codon:yes gene_type:complete
MIYDVDSSEYATFVKRTGGGRAGGFAAAPKVRGAKQLGSDAKYNGE